MKNKRIIINLLNFTDHQIAGVGFFIKNLFRTWFESKHEKFDITIYQASTIDAAGVFGLPSVEGIRYQKVSVGNFVSRIFYEQLILPFRVKGFNCYYSPTPAIPFALKLLNPKIKAIVTIHDMIPFYVPKKYGLLRSIYVKSISKYGPRFADSVITVSENSKKDICSIAGIPQQKVHIVYNFLTMNLDSKNDLDKRFFLTIATIEPGKNFENTVSGYKRFLEKYDLTDFKFYWIGKIGWGYTGNELQNKISALNLQDHFFLPGYVDEGKKNELLRNCTAMVYLSHYEGFGIPVLEGMYHNKPALVSDSSSLPEVVGDAGLLCDNKNPEEIADALYKLISNREVYKSRIPAQLNKFDKDLQLTTFLKVLNA